MPFKSYRQYRFMMSQHPEIAKRWIKEGNPIPKKPKGYRPGKKLSRNVRVK